MKYDIAYTKANAYDVAPLVGAWIEIVISTISRLEIIVAPLVGAWIEIRRPLKLSKTNPASLLL